MPPRKGQGEAKLNLYLNLSDIRILIRIISEIGYLQLGTMAKNKIKPMNPNAHTYDEEPRNQSYARKQKEV